MAIVAFCKKKKRRRTRTRRRLTSRIKTKKTVEENREGGGRIKDVRASIRGDLNFI